MSRPSNINRNIKQDVFKLLNHAYQDILITSSPAALIESLITGYCHLRGATKKAAMQYVDEWAEKYEVNIGDRE